MKQIIIHVDMDAFYASVEVRDDPSLAGKPLIIGALPTERGVVATCSYEARKYGVHSAMNIKEAYRRCPHGLYMHPNFEKYRSVSEQLRKIWYDYAVKMEPIALDEAYLDVTYSAGDFERAGEMAREIKARTRSELGLTCSVGVAYCKTAAKTASEEKKPDGYFEIRTPEDFVELMIDRDVKSLYTVGAKTAEKLNRLGIYTVRDIRERKDEILERFGKHGQLITELAFGIDDRKVVEYKPEDAKSLSREVTFQEDTDNYRMLDDVLVLLALSVEDRARRHNVHGKGVTLKLTYADMQSITRSRLITAEDNAATIYSETSRLLEQVEKRPIRLIGTGLYNLSPDEGRQMTINDYLETGDGSLSPEDKPGVIERKLQELQARYGLDFAGHMDDILHGRVLYRTIEYMRKHY
ncbi:MAG: DNA polymerase IV [Mogibacterium sp.]|nr:DNA polymerase IV [Mogibacterium sp.]MBQ6500499.1 DNA polymerase IV [Mogibacterium sp.]